MSAVLLPEVPAEISDSSILDGGWDGPTAATSHLFLVPPFLFHHVRNWKQ